MRQIVVQRAHGPALTQRFWTLGLLLILGFSLAVSTTWSRQAEASTGNVLYDNWSGQPGWSQDSLSLPITGGPFPQSGAHAETSAVFFNNQWLMYSRHRSYWGGGQERYTIALSTSSDGTNWTFQSDVIVPQANVGCESVSAPKVAVFPPLNGKPAMLAMVYEASSWDAISGCPLPVYRVGIALATSTDGVNWSGNKLILVAKSAWEGAIVSNGRQIGNVGTPYIEYAGGNIYIGYHGWVGNFNGSGPWLQRGVATFNGSDPTQITAIDANYNNNLIHPTSPIVFENQSGGPETNAVYNAGFGEADVIRWQAGSGGMDDGGYYMVFEGWQGPNTLCNSTSSSEVIAMARASSPLGPYLIQDHVLLGSFQGDPLPGGGSQPTSCGRDLPSWQYQGGQYKVVLSNNNKLGNQRIAILSQSLVTDAGLPANGGSGWVIANGGGIYQWNGGGWTQEPGAAVDIAVDPHGLPTVVNAQGSIFNWTGTTWNQLPGPGGPATDVALPADGSPGWIIANGGGIYQWNGGGWTQEPGAAVDIAVDPHGLPTVVNAQGSIFNWTGTTWNQLPGPGGPATDVALPADGSPGWIIANGGGIYQWNGGGWTQKPGAAVDIALGANAYPTVVNSQGNVFNWNGSSWTLLLPNP